MKLAVFVAIKKGGEMLEILRKWATPRTRKNLDLFVKAAKSGNVEMWTITRTNFFYRIKIKAEINAKDKTTRKIETDKTKGFLLPDAEKGYVLEEREEDGWETVDW